MAASLARLNSGASTNYYAKDNYYTKDEGIANSLWWGKGANYLDLNGKVDAEKFKNLMEGKDPEGDKYLGGVKPRERINKETGKPEKHRAGVDVTFGPPKSVSIAALLDGRKDIEEAHKKAVDKTLAEIESKYSICRVGGRGKQVNKVCGNLIVAKFEHDTSRSKDPQLHTHCVIISAVRKPDGEWRRINNEAFWDNSKNINDKYLDNLKDELKKIKVPLIESTKDKTFEIKGYDNVVIANFSKQTQKINKMKETQEFKKAVKMEVEKGRDESKAEKYVERILKIAERDKKGVELSREDLKKNWKKENDQVLSINKNRFSNDLVLNAVGFTAKYVTGSICKRASFPVSSLAQIVVGSVIHEQPIAKETYQYIASQVVGLSVGAIGELVAGPVGGFFGNMIGCGVGYQLSEHIYTQYKDNIKTEKEELKENKIDIIEKKERQDFKDIDKKGEDNSKYMNIVVFEDYQNRKKDEVEMRKETKEKILEREADKKYDKDFDISKYFDKDKSKEKEIDAKDKSNENYKDKEGMFDNKKDVSLEQDKVKGASKDKEEEKTKKREINFDEFER